MSREISRSSIDIPTAEGRKKTPVKKKNIPNSSLLKVLRALIWYKFLIIFFVLEINHINIRSV